jgi:hypothetical protein
MISRELSSMVPVELLEARETEHRVDLAKAQMQLVLYRQALTDNGIEPPDRDSDELLDLYRRCSAVISTASDFAASLGSAKEMLQDFSR